MNLERARTLIHDGIDPDLPLDGLIHVLEAALELVSVPHNDFGWTSWRDKTEARREILDLLGPIKNGAPPFQGSIAPLFAATGPLQELSISSGWAKAFELVAQRYDEVEVLLWGDGR